MADFDAIRRGLAANLAAIDGYQVSLYLLDNPAGKTLQVGDVTSIEYVTFGNSDTPGASEYLVLVEACLTRSTDVGPQKLLDVLLGDGEGSLRAALEADPELTSRMLDNQTVVEDQGAACDGSGVARYLGSAPATVGNGAKVLLASWEIKVIV